MARRRPRRDAELNRERVLAAAVSAIMREGRHVPLATIAAEAGVGVGTLYRRYPDREALLHALEYRSYGLLNQILDEVSPGLSGRAAVMTYLSCALGLADQLVLPLRGAPSLMSSEAVEARRRISVRLDEFISRGHADGSIAAPVNATDVIVFSALLSGPLAFGPDWPPVARRQLAVFANGLATPGPETIPGRAVTREDVEEALALGVPPGPAGPPPTRD